MEKNLRVRGWSNTRFSGIEHNLILFEVMWLGCDCATCRERVRVIVERLTRRAVPWQLHQRMLRENAPSIILSVEPQQLPARVDDYLSQLLGLQISSC